MDPLSATAGVVGILDIVSRLGISVHRFTQDYKLADEELDAAQTHALLLKEEIAALEARATSPHAPPRYIDEKSGQPTGVECLSMDEAKFNQALSTARGLLLDIEAAFPLRSEPHTWRSKVRWALKDKRAFAELSKRLQSVEVTLQGIVSMEKL